MKDKILKLTKKRFVRNVIILSTGTAGAQLIAMLLSPVITRLYGPEAYGLMGSFIAISLIISPVAAFTLPIAIVLPKNTNEAYGIAKLSLILTIIMSILTFVILLIMKQGIVNFFNLEDISSYLLFLPLVVLFGGLLQIIEQGLIRKKKFTVTAKVSLLQSILTNGGKVGVGFFYPTSNILILFTVAQNGLKSLLLLLLSKDHLKVVLVILRSKISIRYLVKKYKNFPLFRAPESFISAISSNLPVLLLASFSGPTSVGFYTISRTVLNVPTQLVGKSVGDVFYPRISEAANNNEKLTPLIKKATLTLGLLGILPFGIIIVFGPQLFGVIFGEQWVVAGEYARWIAFWSYFMFVNKPCVSSLPVLSAQRFHLIHTVITLLTRILMLFIGFYLFNSDVVAVALFGISGGLLSCTLIVVTLYLSKKFDCSTVEHSFKNS